MNLTGCCASSPQSNRAHQRRPHILREGYLEKRSFNRFKGWNRRYVVLMAYRSRRETSYCIKYFRHASSTHELCELPLSSASVAKATENEKRDFTFEITWREGTDAALFQASSEIDRVRWIDAIEDAVGSILKTRPRRTSSVDHIELSQRRRLKFGSFTFRVVLPVANAVVIITSKGDETKGHDLLPFDLYMFSQRFSALDLKNVLSDWLKEELRTPQRILPGYRTVENKVKKQMIEEKEDNSTSEIDESVSVKRLSMNSTASDSLPDNSADTSIDVEDVSPVKSPPVPPLRPTVVSHRTSLPTLHENDEENKTSNRKGLRNARRFLHIWWEQTPKLDDLNKITSLIKDMSEAYRLQETSTLMCLTDERSPLKHSWNLHGLVKDLTLVSTSYASSRLQCEVTGNKILLDMNNRKFTTYSMICRIGELSWSIRRRYKEFAEMHEKVKSWLRYHDRESSISEMPPLPSKTLTGGQLKSGFVERRERALQRYIISLLSMEWSTACEPVLAFFGALSTSRQEKYERNATRSVVHASELYRVVNPGDVILFRTRSTLSELQRLVTVSEFDHIGMVSCREDSDRLWLLEACGDKVVCLPLVPRMKAYAKEYAETIAIRRFESPEITEKMLAELATFTEEVKGKPYSCTPGKLMRRNSKGDGVESSKQDGYFCSELVAAALKRMGLLNRRMANSYYWPGSYCKNAEIDMNLSDGVKLGDLIVVDCESAEVGRAIKRSDFC